MNKRILSSSIVTAAAVGACFGEGPSPTGPSEAVVVFSVAPARPGQECNSSTYIGSLGLGTGSNGYLATLPFQPNNCNGGPTGGSDSIYLFAKAGGHSERITTTSTSMSGGGVELPVAANDSAGFWAYAMNGITVATGSAKVVGSIPAPAGVMGPFSVAGLVADPSWVWIASYSSTGTGNFAQDPNSPHYPCCGFNTGTEMGSGNLFRLPANGSNAAATTLAGTPQFFFNSMPQRIVSNGSALFYLERGDTPSQGVVTRVDLDGTGSASIPRKSDPFTLDGRPVGLAADQTHVAWSTTVDFNQYSNGGTNGYYDTCSIWARTLAAPETNKVLLTTTKFSCMGVAVDDKAVYFAIIHGDTSDHDMTIHGDGIGRISFDGTYESIALGILGIGAGPRRVFLEGDQMFVVDPLAIGKIAKHALDGKNELPFL